MLGGWRLDASLAKSIRDDPSLINPACALRFLRLGVSHCPQDRFASLARFPAGETDAAPEESGDQAWEKVHALVEAQAAGK